MNNIKKIIVFIVTITCAGSFAADALLLEGIQSGNIEKVREALDNGAYIVFSNYHESREPSAICLAYKLNQKAIAQYLYMRLILRAKSPHELFTRQCSSGNFVVDVDEVMKQLAEKISFMQK